MGKIERKYLAHYIDASLGAGFINYVRLGKDLETYSEELNPQVNIQRNLSGQPFVNMEGYQVQSNVEPFYAEYGNALFDSLARIANNRITDDSCRTTKVDVLLNEDGTQVWAYREECWVVPVSIGGDTSGVQIPFNVYCSGNRVRGTFDTVNRIFTEEGEEPDVSPFLPLSVTANGIYHAPVGKGYSQVTVSVPTGPIEVIALSVSTNGQYNSPTGYAYGHVDVSVPGMKELIERTISGAVIDNEVSVIGAYAFASATGLTMVSFPACTIVSYSAFVSCNSLSQAYLPRCERIMATAFSGCGIKSIDLPKCLYLENYAFNRCLLLTTVSAASCLSVGYNTFYNCTSLTSVSLPKCTNLSYGAFYYCGLSEIFLPNCVEIAQYAFGYCRDLTYASFGSSMSQISNSAFAGCNGLMSLYMMYPGVVSLQTDVSATFFSAPLLGGSGTIYVPASLLTAYQEDSKWGVISSRFSGI